MKATNKTREKRMRIVLGISGASGAVYGVRLLQELKRANVEVSLIITEHGRDVLAMETGIPPEELEKEADYSYSNSDLTAPPASGSHPFDAVVICPCSMSTLSRIAAGISDNLITRAAGVCLKEGRRLILVPRETPLSTIYLRNMLSLSEAGAVILPPTPAFYHHPKTMEDLVNFIVGRVLDRLGVEHHLYRRWGEEG